jgi:hypothetical protein
MEPFPHSHMTDHLFPKTRRRCKRSPVLYHVLMSIEHWKLWRPEGNVALINVGPYASVCHTTVCVCSFRKPRFHKQCQAAVCLSLFLLSFVFPQVVEAPGNTRTNIRAFTAFIRTATGEAGTHSAEKLSMQINNTQAARHDWGSIPRNRNNGFGCLLGNWLLVCLRSSLLCCPVEALKWPSSLSKCPSKCLKGYFRIIYESQKIEGSRQFGYTYLLQLNLLERSAMRKLS